ncbi:efflux RND transporter periplasmic adaptor subunit [Catenovulum sp. SM1970]|uniref:efflux RND transporter periplasmic adaptor subunit n=1 Tax=Marinifaba aquimaris TaxID=2741323 RepID=UPI001574ECC5|nr:efflux RND transporter periplasmic adaptor subunit [Marinifaba aquimaris]NTS77726.1 efflux RND transporter periplasmic adaptor subunit [Marinifaba aquimaris]
MHLNLNRFLNFSIATYLVIFSSFSFANAPKPIVNVAAATEVTQSPSVWRSGLVVSRNDALVAARTSGQLTWLLEEGDSVKKGAPLLAIDDAQLQLDLKQNEANIKQQQAQLSFLQSEVKRLQKLAAKNNAAKNLLEQTISEKLVAQALLDAANTSHSKIAQDIEYANLAAPFDGIVTERIAQVGEVVAPGDAVLRVVDIENLDVQVMVPLTSWQFVKPGMALQVKSALGQFELKVRKAVPVGDSKSRLMEVLLDANTIDWPVGLDVQIAVPMPNTIEANVMVPRDALVLRHGESSVFVVAEDKTVKKVAVKAGLGVGANISLQGDIKPGEQVVIRGAERLRAGMAVNVIPAAKTLVSVQGV